MFELLQCSKMRIVLIEDNRILADGIASTLSKTGHAVECFVDGAAADEFLARESADLAIIDINLPSLSGLDVLRRLRRREDSAPVLMLTARDTAGDRVTGLDAGVNGTEIKLPRKELALLECVLDRIGRLVSKDEIADHIYGIGSEAEGRVVEIYISRLRKHLSHANVEIRNARGLGYMLEAISR